jgi:hypothetical protein
MTEGDNITSAELTRKWVDTLAFFDTLVDNGHKLRPIRFLIRHIIDKGYDTKLFPGNSLYDLLISIPTDNKINYDKSLHVSCDQLHNTVVFKYRDTTGLNKNDSASLAKAFSWTDTCQHTEANDTFEYFLTQVDSWVTIKPCVE